MQIKDVLAQQNATLENVDVTEKMDERQFEKFGKVTRVCNATIKDDSGIMTLTLWNEEIESVEEGDKISIIDGWVKEWQGVMQISAGRNGKIVKAGESAPTEEKSEEASEEAKEE